MCICYNNTKIPGALVDQTGFVSKDSLISDTYCTCTAYNGIYRNKDSSKDLRITAVSVNIFLPRTDLPTQIVVMAQIANKTAVLENNL